MIILSYRFFFKDLRVTVFLSAPEHLVFYFMMFFREEFS